MRRFQARASICPPACRSGARRSLSTGRYRCREKSDCVSIRTNALAPELFELDQYGNAHEIGDGTVPDALVEKAYLAKSNCPELAIDIIEE
jgi:ferredoxin